MPVVAVNGTRLEYAEQGRGQPLVFVHGSLEDLRSWRQQVDPFSRCYRTVTYSRRYHYPNPWTGGGRDYSAALHAQDLAGLMDSLGLAPAHVVASSYGGYVALCLAAQRPELIRTLVLGEPPLMPWLQDAPGGASVAAAFEHYAWEPARLAFARGDLDQGVRMFLSGVLGKAVSGGPRPNGRSMLADNAPEMQAETLSADYFSPFTRQEAQRIQHPVLLIQGDDSPQLFRIIVDELARALPNVVRAVIPGTSHVMHLGNAEAYNETVLAFLAKN